MFAEDGIIVSQLRLQVQPQTTSKSTTTTTTTTTDQVFSNPQVYSSLDVKAVVSRHVP